MIKKIAFTGISNLVNSKKYSSSSLHDEYGVPFVYSKTDSDKISMQLNNQGDRDLDEMAPVLKKFRDPRNLNFFRLERLNLGKDDAYIINGKVVDVNDENLDVFSKIQKLLKKIQKEVKSPDIKECYADGDDFKEDKKFSDLSDEVHKLISGKNKKQSEQDLFDTFPESIQDDIFDSLPDSYTESEYKKVLREKSTFINEVRPPKDCLKLSLTKQSAREIENSIQKTMERYFR